MECAKFEELGLLYVSGELNENEAREYEAHLETCEYCKRETAQYKEESASLFTADNLCAEPSPNVDAEIKRVCADPRAMRKPAFMPMMFIKKYAPVPVFLMLVAVAIGGYIRHHTTTAEDLRVKYSAPAEDGAVDIADAAASVDYSGAATSDSADIDVDADASDSAVLQSRPLGKVGVPVSDNSGN